MGGAGAAGGTADEGFGDDVGDCRGVSEWESCCCCWGGKGGKSLAGAYGECPCAFEFERETGFECMYDDDDDDPAGGGPAKYDPGETADEFDREREGMEEFEVAAVAGIEPGAGI